MSSVINTWRRGNDNHHSENKTFTNEKEKPRKLNAAVNKSSLQSDGVTDHQQ